MHVMKETNFPGLKLLQRGKVRDNYDLGDKILIVATDRLSAFDVVMETPIPDKGRVLTQLSKFWFEFFKDTVVSHYITCDVSQYPSVCQPYADQLRGRSMLVVKADQVLPIEAIVRGYLVGSGWKDYKKTGCVCGIQLPPNMQEAQKLPEPLFTPSTKAEYGQHDENISFDRMVELIGEDLAFQVRFLSLKIYSMAAEYARMKGIILADTKFEWGLKDGELILVDEVLTPDSSRFWPVDQYRVGSNPPSFDKQYVRDDLKAMGWKESDGPAVLPPQVVEGTRARYAEALGRLKSI